MNPRPAQRTAACTRANGAARLDQARKFYEVAEIVQSEADLFASAANVAASLAVLAGIAASDAACCMALGRRSRAQDHRAAVDLLRQIVPGGDQAAVKLARLLDLKDAAQYGLIAISAAELKSAMRNAKGLVDFAGAVASRTGGRR